MGSREGRGEVYMGSREGRGGGEMVGQTSLP